MRMSLFESCELVGPRLILTYFTARSYLMGRISAFKEIVLCWIPSHIGIQGNEMVDKQAKISLSLEPTSFKISFSNFKPSINKYILEEWQTSLNNSITSSHQTNYWRISISCSKH